MEPLLPDSDPDLTLAQRLETDATAVRDDALLRALAAYRDATTPTPDAARSARLWEGVATQTRPAARIHRLPTWGRWVAAAACLAAVALGTLWMQPDPALFFAVAPGTAAQAVTLPDGSTVTLRPGSSLQQQADRRYRLQGEAFFAVAHDAAHPFVVEAGTGRVEVLGTRFDVRTTATETTVFLESGRVRFTGADSAVVLAPGQASHLDGGVPVAPAPALPDAALDWLEGRLVFAQQPLARVAAEVELHYGVRLLLPATLARETVTGTLVLGDAAETLTRLARVAGGQLEQMDAQTYRLVVE